MELHTASDGELINAYFEGQEQAFTELVRRYLGPIFRFLRRMLNDTQLAEDITQETFVKAWRSLSRFDRNQSFKTWLFSIARHRAIDELRKKAPVSFSELDSDEEIFEETLVDTRPLPDLVLAHQNLQQELEQALNTLPPLYPSGYFATYPRRVYLPRNS